jgi:hypothetical protein
MYGSIPGVPPDQPIKLIECYPNQSVAEIKKSLQREYKLNLILAIQFIHKGTVLSDNINFSKIGAPEEGSHHRHSHPSRRALNPLSFVFIGNINVNNRGIAICRYAFPGPAPPRTALFFIVFSMSHAADRICQTGGK